MIDSIKYKIQICCGTMCYIMGGAELHLLNDHLPSNLKDKVSIEGIPCIGKCDTKEKHHPCVKINGEELNNATSQKIVKQLLTLENNDLL
ncbi:NAD(P)H-dependent oxidoreductase subunit E [Carboxylicivirga marina]|uniref:NAD(P)H-dependent oxidoreductase subunit E n=1 Tax=Carboxylicivirga marina TaxID=2800988 RepID=A0ABS1HIA6_9BACT|nr:NAD(P)H-dependent oxidoreductase subunit E [Carboxylicivirga marina]MBK3517397.1 NAD(P)H-dependent oxidoreductase subunit E [Carboxylicivirga marina]